MQSKEGLSQNNRWSKGLDPDYVGVDDHSFEELLAFSARYAGLLNFYDTDNKVRGNWTELFTADLTVILALIISEDIKGYKENYQRNEELITQTGLNNKDVLITYYKDIIHSVVSMAQKFNFWILELRQFTEMESAIYDELEQAVKELRISYQRLQAFSLGAKREEALDKDLEIDFGKLTSFTYRHEIEADPTIYAGEKEGEKIKYAIRYLKPIFDSFYDTLTYIKTIAPRYLDESLTWDDHRPQIGLLLTFLKLYKKAQNSINDIKPRHTDFYYYDVLQQAPKEAIPDKVHICLQLAEGTDSYVIKKGTRFVAGKDEEGNVRLYEADDDVSLNQAVVKELRTLYVSKNKYVEIGGAGDLVSGIYEAKLAEDALNVAEETSYAWPTLGEDQVGVSDEGRTMRDASIGFAIASPALQLREGNREINVRITFSRESFSEFKECIQAICENSDSTFDEVFFKAFRLGFHLSVTGEEGWLPVPKYGVECLYVKDESSDDTSITLNFHLDYNEPALTSYDPEIHGPGYNTQWPVARVLLNKDSFIYPYSLLANLILQEITIATQVDEVTDVVVYNDLGQLNTDKPFQPFGPMPKTGSYLMIGSREVFNKAVKDITLTIEWAGLPQLDGGFSDYYRAYEGYDINNSSFKVNFSLLKEGKWKFPKSEDEKTHFLFETTGRDSSEPPHPFSKLKQTTTFEKLSLEDFQLSPDYAGISESLSFDKITKNGFVKFELTGNEVMFGHKKYPFLVSEVFLENAKIKKEKYKKEVPNEPYTPQINSLSLGYTDEKSIKFTAAKGLKDEGDAGQVYHLRPFQFNEKIFPADANEPVPLLPQMEHKGSLYIGISGLNPPDSLTLFFQLEGKNVASFEKTDSDLTWHYLANNKWRQLTASQVLSDSTEKLLRSGIVTLELPRGINKNNTILENSLHWIKVTGSQNIDMIGNTITICTQAAALTWVKESSAGRHLQSSLPAQTITGLEKPAPEVSAVIQPNPSFGGAEQEKQKQFYTRSSERLRHKNRAIVSRDYEQLVLEKFPEIYKVNCLQSTSSHAEVAPGKVLLAVIPKLNEGAKTEVKPMANVSLLRDIKAYVQGLASPFVQVEARNPNYERVRVVCAVRFKEGFNNGQTLKKLNYDIKEFLSPWFYDSVREIQFGGEVNVSEISGFIQSLDYVEFITKLSLLKISSLEDEKYNLSDTARREAGGEKPEASGLQEELKPSTPWSVLVSAKNHHIEILSAEEVIAAEQTGINDLELGNSFIID